MTAFRIRNIAPLVGIAALGIAAGCSSDLTGGNGHPVQLSFTTNTTVASAANRVVADLVVGTNNDLVLQKVQLVFPRLDLDRAGTADCVGNVESDDDHENMGDDCEDVSRNPLLVAVPLDDALHPVINIPLAPGTFSQLEAKLAPARSTATDFNTANPSLVGKSVRVEGTFKGTPFVFTSPVRAKLEMEFDPPLVIDETTKNATIAIDVRKWFLTADGAVIDPTTATPGSTALQQVEQNIRRSFHAFEDDDERGEDHHEGHNGNDDGQH
ncbi:MAG TPA: hypothetical protein VF387_00610 [Gemmatimonadaceae bacterium]